MLDFFEGMLKTSELYKNKSAIVIGNKIYSYQEILQRAFLLAIQFLKYRDNKTMCIIISDKSIELYLGMLACFFSNSIYTPINVHAGVEKNKLILEMMDQAFIFVGEVSEDILCDLILSVSNRIIFFIKKQLYDCVKRINKKNLLFCLNDFSKDESDWYVNYFLFYQVSKKQSIAYLFFTSGSTGIPKPVPISYKNLSSYISNMLSLFCFESEDRFIQLSDIAFDISIHEIIVCLSIGATLYVYDDQHELSVSRFIAKNKITQCSLVPSSMMTMIEQCQFYKCNFNSLKNTFVCGEPFPVSFAKAWEVVAPNSLIANLYGPTEATVVCAYYIYQKQHDYGDLLILPIGQPFPNTQLSLTHQDELIISGDQVSSGYWLVNNSACQKFQYNAEKDVMSYYTGDHVTYHKHYGYLFHGRLDDQWQLKGYRIEKAEVESILRSVLDVHDLCVIPQYDENNLVSKLAAFSSKKVDIKKNRKKLASYLPEAAIPFCVIQLDVIPKLPNGKINYRYLSERVLS